jgi:hypothetical protein
MSRSLKLKMQTFGSPKADAAPDSDISKPAPDADALLSFAAETEKGAVEPEKGAAEPEKGTEPAPPTPRRVWRRPVLRYAAALAVLIVGGVLTASLRVPRATQAAAAVPVVQVGTATIDSSPPGADVLVDGIARGQTPLRLALPGGEHALELNLDGVRRTLSLQIAQGAHVSQYVELAPASPPAAVASTGRLEIGSDPAGAQVSVDGAPRGTTPLTIAAIAPGDHTVAISSGSGTITRRVTVAAGNTATIFASVTAAGTAAGWVAIKAPIDLEIYQAGRLAGTTAFDRLMLPAGRHELELVNADLQFRRTVTVQVVPGNTATTVVEMPNGSLWINALPWADVWIDGRPHGTTPLGNLSVPIGSHEIVWRHPQLGERRRTIAVTATTPVRVGMDFNQ